MLLRATTALRRTPPSAIRLVRALCRRPQLVFPSVVQLIFAVHVADTAGPPDASLAAYVHRVSLMKKTHERYAAMLEARDAPTVYNVWRRMA